MSTYGFFQRVRPGVLCSISAMLFVLIVASSNVLHAQSQDTVQQALDALDAASSSIGVNKTTPPNKPISIGVKSPPMAPLNATGNVKKPPSNWRVYVNKRFGTRIHYPADLLPSGFSLLNGDGTTMKSGDGRIELRVFAGFNALGHSLREHEVWLRDEMVNQTVTYEFRGKNRFVLFGTQGAAIFYEKRIFSADNETIHGFSLQYPATEKALINPIVTRLSKTFAMPAPEPEIAKVATSPVASAWSPQRGDPNRKAIINAVRPAIERDIGGPVEFGVDVIRTNGIWAYLQATPQRPGGVQIDWTRTKFARAMAEGMMSDMVMALLVRSGSSWSVEDYVLGPTDVYWISWVTDRGIPERLFHSGRSVVD